MARFQFSGQVRDGMGRAVPAATVAAYLAGTTTAAKIYAASSGGVSISSVTADASTGYFTFWVDTNDYAANQLFKVVASAPNYQYPIGSITWDNVIIFPSITPLGVLALTPSSTIAANFGLATVFTLVPNQSASINASGGIAGGEARFVITTSGTVSYTLTFGTNFKSTGTLATGTSSGKVFTVSFCYDGTNWNETSRTGAM